jgi:hypothetical protein
MLQFLRRRVRQVAASVIDPWREVDCYYVGLYRRQLDGIAEALSESGSRVWTRFNAKLKRAELCDDSGTIASVVMHGEVGFVYRTIIQTLLGEQQQSLFASALPHVQFVNVAPD